MKNYKSDVQKVAMIMFSNVKLIGLLSLFNGISTFEDYLMSKPFLKKNSNDTI